ncbi:MAG: GerMN domain-containing protein [Patescibacteria group bacterium]
MTDEIKPINTNQQNPTASSEPLPVKDAASPAEIQPEQSPAAEDAVAPVTEISAPIVEAAATIIASSETIAEEPVAVQEPLTFPASEAKAEDLMPASAAVKPDAAPAAEKTIAGGEEQPVKKTKSGAIIAIAVALVVILSLIYWAVKPAADNDSDNHGQSVQVSDAPEQGKVNIIEEVRNDISVAVSGNVDEPAYPQTKVTVYFGNTVKNPNSIDCALAYPLDRETDKKYDSAMVNTVLGLLKPLSPQEKEQGFVSAIPNGTILKYLKLDDSGVMSANFSGAISRAAGSCAVTAIRSQIEATLLQFSAVKSVVICIDGDCQADRILQP